MLVGVPASGKTFWRKNCNTPHTTVCTDDIIYRIGEKYGMTYDEIFNEAINLAQKIMNHNIQSAIAGNKNIVWDQTNLTAKSRKRKLLRLPGYQKVAVYFETPESSIHKLRLISRNGKTIPASVLASMMHVLEKPTKSEGFDRIIDASIEF
tara:strand:+ start:1404 stop:1856 length:453 start_codon:yes stop_codon:yes gene_type:complete